MRQLRKVSLYENKVSAQAASPRLMLGRFRIFITSALSTFPTSNSSWCEADLCFLSLYQIFANTVPLQAGR